MTLEQIKAVVIGHAVGDALGVPVEFKTREDLAKDPVMDMRGYGSYAVPAGTWSDDTSMSLCALAALCRKDWTFEEVMDNFFAWMSDNRFTATDETFDVGNTCFNAILNYRQNGIPVSECGLSDSYDGCVLKAVNLGEDTDTVAAVAGGLAGALYGYDAIPLSWRTTLKRREEIEALCADFHHTHFA